MRYIYVVTYRDDDTDEPICDYFGTMARARRRLKREGYVGGPTSYELRDDLEGSQYHYASINRERVQ